MALGDFSLLSFGERTLHSMINWILFFFSSISYDSRGTVKCLKLSPFICYQRRLMLVPDSAAAQFFPSFTVGLVVAWGGQSICPRSRRELL